VGAVEDDHVTAVEDQDGGIGMVVSLKFGLGKKIRLVRLGAKLRCRQKYSDGYFVRKKRLSLYLINVPKYPESIIQTDRQTYRQTRR
jgi:hypothetical protein